MRTDSTTLLCSLTCVLAGLAVQLLPAASAGAERFDFEQRYFMEPGLIAADHAILVELGEFHLFYTVGIQGEGWMYPNNMVDFGHATSTDLIHWQVQDRVLSIEAPGWKERNLWAPHVIRNLVGQDLLFYAGVDSAVAQQIGVAYSPDLYDWSEPAFNPVYRPDTTWAQWREGAWSNCRDPFVNKLDNEFALLTTCSTRPGYLGHPDSLGAISLAFSSNGFFWNDAGPLFINDSGKVLESPYLVDHQGTWYLFYNEQAVSGVQYMTSSAPYSGWDKSTAQLFEFEGFAAEVFERNNQWLFARVRDAIWADETILGVKIDALTWNGATPVIGSQNTLLENWTIVEGNAFDTQPTFGDRPRDRTGVDSNLEGFFWINTAELHGGPIVWGCPECPPDESLTGTLRSHSFEISENYIELRVGGGDDPDNLMVALVRASDGVALRSATGLDSQVMRQVVWDVSQLDGVDVYLEIIDHRSNGPFGFISVDAIEEVAQPTGIGEVEGAAGGAPRALAVMPVTPARAPVRFLLEAVVAGRYRLAVHDAGGHLVRELDLGRLAPGRHRIIWDGRTARGSRAPRGVYFYRIHGVAGNASGKLVLTR